MHIMSLCHACALFTVYFIEVSARGPGPGVLINVLDIIFAQGKMKVGSIRMAAGGGTPRARGALRFGRLICGHDPVRMGNVVWVSVTRRPGRVAPGHCNTAVLL